MADNCGTVLEEKLNDESLVYYSSLACDEIITSDDQIKYDSSRICWNRAIDAFPKVIAYCSNVQHVCNCITFAKTHALPIRIRSGGHSYEGFSTGDNVMIIDVSRMKSIELDTNRKQAKIGAGVQNIELFTALKKDGFIAAGGACPTVGVVGFMMGGGWSFASREFGIGCDSVLEFEIVDFDGNLLTVNSESHADLFWACRGAGAGNFGVCVSVTLKVFDNYDRATFITLNYPNCCAQKIVYKINAWQEFFTSCDTRFNGKINIYNCRKDGIGFEFLLVFFGSAEEAKSLIKPLIEYYRPDDESSIGGNRNIPYLSVQESSIFQTYKTICDIHPDFERFKSTGGFMNRALSTDEIRKLIEIVKDKASGCIYTAFSLYGMGGKIEKVPHESTAFAYRNAHQMISFQTQWEEEQFAKENKEWLVERVFSHVLPLVDGIFANFPLLELKDFKKLYYGNEEWRQEKLTQVKNQYDPLNIFSHSQSL